VQCASIVVCYGGKITLGRSVYGCETRRLTLTARSVAIAALNVMRRHWQSCCKNS
jgi:hypothetical protein